jgi:hypothetical protein
VTTGAIGVDFESGPPVVPMSEEEAVAAILQGHRSGAYRLPAPLIAAAEGAASVADRAYKVHGELTAATEALGAGPGRLMATIVRESATSGTLSKTDAGAEMVKLEAVVARLRHADRVLQVAAERIADYPATILRGPIAGDVHAALDAGLGELLTAARPHAARIAALEPGSGNLAGFRAHPAGFDALERLVPRLAALDAAGAALDRLGRPWPGLPADDGAPSVIRLARLAAHDGRADGPGSA